MNSIWPWMGQLTSPHLWKKVEWARINFRDSRIKKETAPPKIRGIIFKWHMFHPHLRYFPCQSLGSLFTEACDVGFEYQALVVLQLSGQEPLYLDVTLSEFFAWICGVKSDFFVFKHLLRSTVDWCMYQKTSGVFAESWFLNDDFHSKICSIWGEPSGGGTIEWSPQEGSKKVTFPDFEIHPSQRIPIGTGKFT